MMEDLILKYFVQLGFPAFVAGYVLIRLESVMKETRDAVRDLVAHLKDETKRRVPE